MRILSDKCDSTSRLEKNDEASVFVNTYSHPRETDGRYRRAEHKENEKKKNAARTGERSSESLRARAKVASYLLGRVRKSTEMLGN